MLKYQSKEMPCIKASCFGFEFENEAGVKKTFSFKKWKDVCMNVESFEHYKTQVLDYSLDLAELCLDQLITLLWSVGKEKRKRKHLFLTNIQLAAMTIIITITKYKQSMKDVALCADTHEEDLKYCGILTAA